MLCLLAQPPNNILAAAELIFLVAHQDLHENLTGLHNYYCCS